jgi:hypothetical protein
MGMDGFSLRQIFESRDPPCAQQEVRKERMNMKICGIFLVLALALTAGSVSAAIGLDTIPVSPPGDLIGGETQAESSFTLNFIAIAGEKSPIETLELDTGLADPEWTISVLENDSEEVWRTATSAHLMLEGSEQVFPASGKIPVRITLRGTAPAVMEQQVIEVIRVTVIPGNNSLVEMRTVVPGPGANTALAAGPVPASADTTPGTTAPAAEEPALEKKTAPGDVSTGNGILERILSFFRNLFG